MPGSQFQKPPPSLRAMDDGDTEDVEMEEEDENDDDDHEYLSLMDVKLLSKKTIGYIDAIKVKSSEMESVLDGFLDILEICHIWQIEDGKFTIRQVEVNGKLTKNPIAECDFEDIVTLVENGTFSKSHVILGPVLEFLSLIPAIKAHEKAIDLIASIAIGSGAPSSRIPGFALQ